MFETITETALLTLLARLPELGWKRNRTEVVAYRPLIRLDHPYDPERCTCPLNALCLVLTGVWFDTGCFFDAGRELGLTPDLALSYARAADDWGEEAERTALLIQIFPAPEYL